LFVKKTLIIGKDRFQIVKSDSTITWDVPYINIWNLKVNTQGFFNILEITLLVPDDPATKYPGVRRQVLEIALFSESPGQIRRRIDKLMKKRNED